MKKKFFTLICLSFLLSGAGSVVEAAVGLSGYTFVNPYSNVNDGWKITSDNPKYDGSAISSGSGIANINAAYVFSGCNYELWFTGVGDSTIYFRFVAVNSKDNTIKDTLTNYSTLPSSYKFTSAERANAQDKKWEELPVGSKNWRVPYTFSIGDIPAKYDSITIEWKTKLTDPWTTNQIGRRFANYPKVEIDYVAPVPTNAYSRADIIVTGGTKNLARSVNGGITWTKVWDTDEEGNYYTIPLTPEEISNLTTIYFKDPNTCGNIPIVIKADPPVIGPNPTARPVTMPYVSGITASLAVGVHRVESGKDLVFTITVNDPALEPKVETDRPGREPDNDVVITPKGDGVFEVTVKAVNSPINLSIRLVPLSTTTVEGSSVWAANGQVYVTAATATSAKVFGATGALVKQVALGAGETTGVTLPAGFYIVTLNGKAYKVILK